jgi:hypothetical protein
MRESFKRYSLAWVTGSIFLVLLSAQWASGWSEYVLLQREHGAQIHVSTYLFQAARATLENWQAEFFPLLCGLADRRWERSAAGREDRRHLAPGSS